ncbi:MAG: PfkB family carbohydrate kinase [Candidatus Paceibacterota bacterium]|jgi:fructokinase
MIPNLLSFGEIVWDKIDGVYVIGGAPFNVSAHLVTLGGEAALFSAIGNDLMGEKALEVVRSARIKENFIERIDMATCCVNATADTTGNVKYDIPHPTTFDSITASDIIIKQVYRSQFDFLYFGSIAQRDLVSRRALSHLVNEGGCRWIIFDVNLRFPFHETDTLVQSCHWCNIIKMNRKESLYLSEYFGFRSDDVEEISRRLCERFNITIVCVTDGADGAFLYADQQMFYCVSPRVRVVDTVGAGDAFTAAVILGMAQGRPPAEILSSACKTASAVAACRGSGVQLLSGDISMQQTLNSVYWISPSSNQPC